MQVSLDSNNILMYSIHNEDNSVITERFIKTSKTNIYVKIIANDRKSYLSCLNKIVDQYNKSFHHSIGKNLLMLIILL